MNVYVNVGDPIHVHPGEKDAKRVDCEDGDAATSGGHFHWSGAVSLVEASRPVGSVMSAMVACLDLTP